MKSRYRIQYADQHRFGEMSEWRDADVPLTETDILGIHFETEMTQEEAAEYMKWLGVETK